MEAFAVWFLLSLNLLLGIEPIPDLIKKDWVIQNAWISNGQAEVFSAKAELPALLCNGKKDASVVFPRVIHSAYRIAVNGHVVMQEGDPTFQLASPFYAQPVIPCVYFPPGSTTQWDVWSYSSYFSRFSSSPYIQQGNIFRNLFNVDANIVSAGVLIVLSLLSLFLFAGRINYKALISISFGSFLFSGYFLNVANSRIGISLSMLQSHRVADLCIWLGAFLFFYAFYLEKMVSRITLIMFGISILIGSIIVTFGKSGSQIQLGTIVPMFFYVTASLECLIILVRHIFSKRCDRHHVTRLLSMLSFFVAADNDVLTIFGLIDNNMILSVGMIGGFFGMAVAVNQDIDRTYQERDSLLGNLEKKVTEKTQDLTATLSALKSTQAELVQSAKLASLGTLSAGVAHEINNSINYVSGALKPLERKLSHLLAPADQVQIMKLLEAIKEGTSLTVGIVNSLRVYTGLNQAPFKEFNLHEVVQSTLTILKSKSRGTEIVVQMDSFTPMAGSMVGISQIVMNLVANSIDALPKEGGRILISATSAGEPGGTLTFRIHDNGAGIPQNLQERIFEPFFTTKEVGKGTGLGLHIVRQEIERHRGEISLISNAEHGTEFIMKFPRRIESLVEAA